MAAEALLAPIRKQSADVASFVAETIKRVNAPKDNNAQLLLKGDRDPANIARVVRLLLGEAHIPTENVHTLTLDASKNQQPKLWLRTYNGKSWLYFNPVSGQKGLPDNQLVWWIGDKPLVSLNGGSQLKTEFSVHQKQASALSLAKTLNDQGKPSFVNFSLYEIPVGAQQLMKIILMIPVGVLLVLLMRSVIGLETLGTFTPVLIALAFRETHLLWGIILFTCITAFGLIVRSYLEYLKLQLMARLSVVLTMVVVIMSVISLLSYKLGLSTGLSVALFPMVILTMCIERVSIVWDERGGPQSIKIGIVTLFVASICYLVMIFEPLAYLVFTFPGCLLILAAIMVLLGHYRGYRLLELTRFRVLSEEDR